MLMGEGERGNETLPLYLERPRSYKAAPLLDDVELPSILTGQKHTWRRRETEASDLSKVLQLSEAASGWAPIPWTLVPRKQFDGPWEFALRGRGWRH